MGTRLGFHMFCLGLACSLGCVVPAGLALYCGGCQLPGLSTRLCIHLGWGCCPCISLSGSWAWGGDQLELQPEDIALCPEMVGGMPPKVRLLSSHR